MRCPWYFGWNIVIAAAFLTLFSSGLRMSMGTFFLPIANDLNFSRSVLSFGTSFVSSVSFTPIITRWFIKRRGLALFILSTGSMAGIAVMLPVFAFFISIFGWKITLVSFSVIFMIITLPIAFFIMKDNNAEIIESKPNSFVINIDQSNLKLIDVLKT